MTQPAHPHRVRLYGGRNTHAAQPGHTVDEELRHLRIAQAGHDLALQAACRKTEEQRQRAEQAEAAIERVRDELSASLPALDGVRTTKEN